MTNDEIDELVGLKDVDKNFLRARQNGLLLTDSQVATLGKHNIDISKCKDLSQLIYLIHEYTGGYDEGDYEELEMIADDLAERNYYENVNK